TRSKRDWSSDVCSSDLNKAYQLDKHVIAPYKKPQARQPQCKGFNHVHANERIHTEHIFEVLKARWPSLRGLPLRIRHEVEKDQICVICWIMACLVLHNYLSLKGESDGDSDSWLGDDIVDESTAPEDQADQQTINTPVKHEDIAVKLAGQELRESLCQKIHDVRDLVDW